MTITDKQALCGRIDARFECHSTSPVERANITLSEWTALRAALEAAEAARERDTPVAWVEVNDTHRGPYQFHGIELLPEGRHELFLSDQTTLREVTSAAPSSAEQAGDAEYVLRMLVAAGHVTQEKVDEARGIAATLAHSAPAADERADFEACMRPHLVYPNAFDRDPIGSYVYTPTSLAWIAWHARAKSPARAQAGEAVGEIVFGDEVHPQSVRWSENVCLKVGAKLYATPPTPPADARDGEDDYNQRMRLFLIGRAVEQEELDDAHAKRLGLELQRMSRICPACRGTGRDGDTPDTNGEGGWIGDCADCGGSGERT